MNPMKARNLVGLQVIAQGGRNVGAIRDVLVDIDKWRVDALSVRLTRETLEQLNLRKPFLGSQTVLIPVKEVSGASDNLVLKRTLEEMKFLGGEEEERCDVEAEKGECVSSSDKPVES